MQSRIATRIVEFRQALETNITAESAIDILESLGKESLTSDIIKATKIGATVHTIKKRFAEHPTIPVISKKLIRSWKDIYHTMSDGSESQDRRSNRGVSPQESTICRRTERIPTAPKFSQTFTITFGDQAENHVGMQKIGSLAAEGFNLSDLERAKAWFESRGTTCTLISLHHLLPSELQYTENEAYVLVARKGLVALLDRTSGPDDLFQEQEMLDKDRQAFMYGRVVNKHARHNLCFGSFNQEPNYAEGKGRVISFSAVPLLQTVRETLGDVIGEKGAGLEAEGNYYYDLSKCGIGYHGDTERRKVVAVRLGADIPLYYLWFRHSVPIVQTRESVSLSHGDVYIMSEKATGQDWKKKNIPTLRHATGADKFVGLPKKRKKD